MVLAVTVGCVAGLSGCITPTHTYDEIHARGWTRESFEQRFPAGTTEKQVFNKLGSPFASKNAGDLTRWDYVGGVSGQEHVMFIFRNAQLVEKRYENF
ncbi:hypothetical protein AAGS40_07975 [Paraburkholderia sp. PREW-6R]|uniref:hypothetical protein n=1 Tax=Paraburkholderia sp. PREW-6R TaxID=3141544 RepID=UPI0031F57330